MKLEKRRITAIQKRFKNHEPLNLSAVQAEAPWLLKDLFKPECFHGWYQLLEKAGIVYSDISYHESILACCKLCGYTDALLRYHLESDHGIGTADYRAQFMGAEVVCEATRSQTLGRRHGRKSKMIQPHWEPAWSKFYILDRLFTFYRSGIPINRSYIYNLEPGLTSAAINYFGSYDNALRAMGFDPMDIRKATYMRKFTPESVLSAIQKIYKKNPDHLHIPSIVISPAMIEISACFKYYSSFADALSSAGINPSELIPAIDDRGKLAELRALQKETKKRIKNKVFYDPVKVQKFMAKHQNAIDHFFISWDNFKFSYGYTTSELFHSPETTQYNTKERAITGLNDRKTANLSMREQMCRVDNPALRYMGIQHFGSWKKALRKVKLKIPPREYPMRYNSKKDIIDAVLRRHREGKSLHSTDLVRPPAQDHALVTWARHYFGSLGKAVLAAGIQEIGPMEQPLNAKNIRYPNAKKTLEGIQKRKREGLSMLRSVVIRSMASGGDSQLSVAARKHFGSWDAAIKKAGIQLEKPPTHPRRKRQIFSSPEVLKAIRHRKKLGQPLDSSSLAQPVSSGGDGRLYNNAVKFFGSWEKAVKAAKV